MADPTFQFNWLHLTDLHWGLSDQDVLWPNIKGAFYDSLETIHSQCGPWHAVLFTGDLVQDGTMEQFDQLQAQVITPLFEHLKKLGSENVAFLPVPGNHDLQRPPKTPRSAVLSILRKPELFENFRKEIFSSKDNEYLQEFARSFSGYTEWLEQLRTGSSIQFNVGVVPGDFSATLPVSNGRGIGIAGLNTAFLQLQRGNFHGKLAWDPRQLHEVCDGDPVAWSKQHDFCILMTHHGPAWLNSRSATNLYSEINPAGRFVAHLFGHTHKPFSTEHSVGGGELVRLCQGRSLFGLMEYGEPPDTERLHGFSAWRIEVRNGRGTIRQWPLKATNEGGGDWRLVPDHDLFTLLLDNGTEPREFVLPKSRARPPSNGGAKHPDAFQYDIDDRVKPEMLVFYCGGDERLVAILVEELGCFGWTSLPYLLDGGSFKATFSEAGHSRGRVFCFVASAGFDSNPTCLAMVQQVRHECSEARRLFVCVGIENVKCVASDAFVCTKEGRGGVQRIDIIDLAEKLDALGRNLPYPRSFLKARRDIYFMPNPITKLLSQNELRIPRNRVVEKLLHIVRSHRVVAISGMPSSGRSALAVDLLMNLTTREPDRAGWPMTVIGTRVCDGSVPDLPRLCSIVFDALGPPPGAAEDDRAVALVRLLEACETWLVLDQFEAAIGSDGRCKDPDLARFLRIADDKLDKGRVIVTASSASVDFGRGQSCVNFSIPEWTHPELKELAVHIAETMKVPAPAAQTLHKLQDLASGNPYLMFVAVRQWSATGFVPAVLNSKLKPYELLGGLMKTVSVTGMAILHILDLYSTFSAGVKLIRRTLKQIHRQALDLKLPATMDVDSELASLRDMGLIQIQYNNTGETHFRLPGLVSDCLQKEYPLEQALRHDIAKVLAGCILEGKGDVEDCFDLVAPANCDGQSWRWGGLSNEVVGRAVRAANVLIGAGDTSYAAELLMGEKTEVLKTFNRIAPASVRSNFFSRFRVATQGNPITYQEATRGLALAQADMAEYSDSIKHLHEAIDVLEDTSEQIAPDEVNRYKAKDLELIAYCERHLKRFDNSADTYRNALRLLVTSGCEDDRCKSLRGLGNSLLALGDYSQARQLFDDSEEIAKDLPTPRRIFNLGRINCDRAILEMHNGDLGTAKMLCIDGMSAMRECGDLWNERIASMNLCGIELALHGDVEDVSMRLKALIEEFNKLENLLALQCAAENLETLVCSPATVRTPNGWNYVELM